jgi:hypothetical protein
MLKFTVSFQNTDTKGYVKGKKVYRISGFHSSGYEEYHLLEYDAV